ncbi:uncharacterized protein D12 [Euwallacea similis]|uniref:uncharacterized protein D12 n=1 Tax=Euwallacea similis TaxID=1736056 RepID=UPI00344E5178
MDGDNNKNNDNIKIEIDPDYETTNTAIWNAELQEEEDNQLTETKLRKIIQEEFDKELQQRQKQLEEIEEIVFKAQKLLHVVRYVLISSYYNSKALEAETALPSDPTNLLQGQNRIHPALKKLLGNNANNLKFLGGRTKRKAALPKLDLKTEAKKIKLEPSNEISTTSTIKLAAPKQVDELVTNRTKVQHRVVIGNISYFKKSLEQNNLTHKWMVYVKIFKGPSGGAEVTNQTVSKVVFYLHPSYKPHDVVDISQPPFHLSRRGWGEFPLRVKIYFKAPMNKPVDVIHQLKLDNTFTERQMLGNETTIPVFLYDDSIYKSTAEVFNEKQQLPSISQANNVLGISSLENIAIPASSLSGSQIFSINPVKIEITDSYDHDYCNDTINFLKQKPSDHFKREITELEVSNQGDICLLDHSYSITSDKECQTSPKKNKSPVKQAYNELIYGLGPHYLDPVRCRARSVRPKIIEKVSVSPEKNANSILKVLKTVTGQSIRFLPESFNQVLFNNGGIISVKILKSPSVEGLKPVKKLFGNKHELLKLPEYKFKNMGEALPYLFKRVPLWTQEALNEDYKCTYPFTACSREEYYSWNIGKRLAAEWSRAKTIKRIVSREPFSRQWSTKAIVMYGRSHLYTPVVASYKLFEKESQEKRLILDCYQGNSHRNGHLVYPHSNGDEQNINIMSDSPKKSVIDRVNANAVTNCIDISDKNLSQECVFVKEAALDVGVLLKPEVLVPGVSMNASERLMFEAVKSFAENVIRRSRNSLICRRGYKDAMSEATILDVRNALEERKEFEAIKKFKENKKTVDFFS